MWDQTLPNSPSHSEDQTPAAGESQQERPGEGAGVWGLRVSGNEEQRNLRFFSQPQDRDGAQGQVRGSGMSSCLLPPAPSTVPPCLLRGCCPALSHSPAPNCHTHPGCRTVTVSPGAGTARRHEKRGHQAVSMWEADYFLLFRVSHGFTPGLSLRGKKSLAMLLCAFRDAVLLGEGPREVISPLPCFLPPTQMV